MDAVKVTTDAVSLFESFDAGDLTNFQNGINCVFAELSDLINGCGRDSFMRSKVPVASDTVLAWEAISDIARVVMCSVARLHASPSEVLYLEFSNIMRRVNEARADVTAHEGSCSEASSIDRLNRLSAILSKALFGPTPLSPFITLFEAVCVSTASQPSDVVYANLCAECLDFWIHSVSSEVSAKIVCRPEVLTMLLKACTTESHLRHHSRLPSTLVYSCFALKLVAPGSESSKLLFKLFVTPAASTGASLAFRGNSELVKSFVLHVTSDSGTISIDGTGQRSNLLSAGTWISIALCDKRLDFIARLSELESHATVSDISDPAHLRTLADSLGMFVWSVATEPKALTQASCEAFVDLLNWVFPAYEPNGLPALIRKYPATLKALNSLVLFTSSAVMLCNAALSAGHGSANERSDEVLSLQPSGVGLGVIGSNNCRLLQSFTDTTVALVTLFSSALDSHLKTKAHSDPSLESWPAIVWVKRLCRDVASSGYDVGRSLALAHGPQSIHAERSLVSLIETLLTWCVSMHPFDSSYGDLATDLAVISSALMEIVSPASKHRLMRIVSTCLSSLSVSREGLVGAFGADHGSRFKIQFPPLPQNNEPLQDCDEFDSALVAALAVQDAVFDMRILTQHALRFSVSDMISLERIYAISTLVMHRSGSTGTMSEPVHGSERLGGSLLSHFGSLCTTRMDSSGLIARTPMFSERLASVAAGSSGESLRSYFKGKHNPLLSSFDVSDLIATLDRSFRSQGASILNQRIRWIATLGLANSLSILDLKAEPMESLKSTMALLLHLSLVFVENLVRLVISPDESLVIGSIEGVSAGRAGMLESSDVQIVPLSSRLVVVSRSTDGILGSGSKANHASSSYLRTSIALPRSPRHRDHGSTRQSVGITSPKLAAVRERWSFAYTPFIPGFSDNQLADDVTPLFVTVSEFMDAVSRALKLLLVYCVACGFEIADKSSFEAHNLSAVEDLLMHAHSSAERDVPQAYRELFHSSLVRDLLSSVRSKLQTMVPRSEL